MPRVTSKGQVTIPMELRRKLGLSAGSEVTFEWDGQGARIRKAERASTLRKWRGALRLSENVDAFVDRMRGGRDRRG
ncbi:MAG: AbrB/MazE/SpoVT family DNA-binding domain-containing protein [Acidobacteriota bacterium]